MAAFGPSTLAAPVNLVTIQARLALADKANPQWVIQPNFLVFGEKRPPTPPPAAHVHKTRRARARTTRDPDVLDAWTATAEEFGKDVVCLGVALAPLACSENSSEGVKRFALAIAGSVTLACDREEIKHALPGDTLYWESKQSDLEYIGIAAAHRTAVIKALPRRGTVITRSDCETAMEVHLARDPAALAFYRDPELQAFDPAQPHAPAAVGGRIGTLLALGGDDTNVCLVDLHL